MAQLRVKKISTSDIKLDIIKRCKHSKSTITTVKELGSQDNPDYFDLKRLRRL